jgi:hypothetical protein
MGDIINLPPSGEQLQKLHQEHEICARRGHEPNHLSFNDANTGVVWHTCVWCETQYSVQEAHIQVERHTPTDRSQRAPGA